MRLVYGGAQIGDTSWAKVQWGRELQLNDAQIGHGFRYSALCSEVGFRVAGQANAALMMLAVENALAVQGRDLILENDDGSPSANSVFAANCLLPPRCTRGPVWADTPGAQFVTHRTYACEFEWEVALAGGSPLLLAFTEQVTVEGGTPRTVVHETINSGPVAQVTVPVQKFRVTQRGAAVGLYDYPLPAAPLYAAPPIRNPVTRTTPDRVGNFYRGGRTEWLYYWEFTDAPFVVTPNQWVG